MHFLELCTLCVVFAVLSTDQVEGFCGVAADLTSNNGEAIIDSDCNFASIMITSSTTSSIYQTRGVMGDMGQCQIYDGTDNTGILLGTFTGDGNAVGAVRSSSNNLFLSCVNTGGPTITWRHQVSDRECGSTLTGGDFYDTELGPFTLGSYCIWTFLANPGCSYRFDVKASIAAGDYIFINWPEGASGITGEPARYGMYAADSDLEESWANGGNKVRFMFASDLTAGEPSDYISFNATQVCPPPPVSQLKCGETTIINLVEESLKKLNASDRDILYIAPSEDMKPEDVDPSCVANIQHPYFVFNITQCVPVTSQSDGLIKLTFIVWNQKNLDPSAPVQRYMIFCVNFTCEFDSNVTISSSEIDPEIRKIGFNTDPAEGEFQVSLDLYSNDSYENPLSADDTVTVPEYVFAKVKLTDVPESADNFQVDMTSCWATEEMNPTSVPIYPIITASCPASNPYDPSNAIVVIRNNQPICGQFKFRSFVWTNVTEQALYVHCDVNICDTDAGSCPEECGGKRRRRRDITTAGKKQILSAGPIVISFPQTTSELQDDKDQQKVEYVNVEEVLGSIRDSHDQEMYAFLAVVLVVLIGGVIYHFALK
uniref:Alpha-tectorin-like n=1 Tax=Phallusia mammillata TaxID=59560 RepID=A0A6F9DTY8_9ASCI|nr:alpha-tectorin-like [Phallusia mammillata]